MQYEYKTFPITPEETCNLCEGLTAKLNHVGKQGWELVTVFSQNALGSTPYNILGLTQKQFFVVKRAIKTGSSAN